MKENEKLNNSLNLLAKSSTIVFIGIIFSKSFIYAYRIIIARHFGPEIYGLLILSTMIIAWLISLSSFGLIDGILRFVSFYRGKNEIEKIRYVFSWSKQIFLIFSISFAIILFFSSGFIAEHIMHNSELDPFLKIFSFLIPLAVFGNTFLSIIKAYEMIKLHTFILNILENSIKILFLIFFIFIGLKKEAVIFSYFLAIFTTFLASYYVCKTKIKGLFKKYNLTSEQRDELRNKLINYSFPLLFSGVMYSLIYGADSFLIGYFKDIYQVGIYNSAVPIALIINIIPGLFITLFFPLINKEYAKNNIKLIENLSKQVGKWIFLMGVPIFILILLFPEFILNLLFGEEYIIAADALRILSVGALFSATFSIPNQLILMKGKSKTILFDLSASVILNLLLNLLLIPNYGIVGASIATTISSIFLGLLYLYQCNHYLFIIPFKKQSFISFIFSIFSIGVIIYLNTKILMNIYSFAILSLFFILSYLFFILLFGIDKNDLIIIKSIRDKLNFIKYNNIKIE